MISLSPQVPPATKDAGPHLIIKKFAYLLSARWLRDALQAIFLIYLARLSVTTYGEFMLALGLGAILTVPAELGLNLPLVAILARKEADREEALLQVSLLKSATLFLTWLGVLAFMEWQAYGPALKLVLIIIGAGVSLDALASSFFVAFQVQGRQDLESKVKALSAVLAFGYGLVCLLLGAPPWMVACFKLIEALVNLAGGVGLAILWFRPRWKWPSLTGLWPIIQRGLVFVLLQIAAETYGRANLFFLQRYSGADAVGQYSAAWQVVDGFTGLISALLLQSVLYPLFVRLWGVDRAEMSRLAQNATRWLLALAGPLMFLLYIESDRLIPLVYGPHFKESIWLQKYLVITVAIGFLHNLAAYLIMSMKRERFLLILYLGGLVFNLGWCSWVMPAAPLLGAALAMVLTRGGVALMTVSYAQRRLGLISGKALLQLAAMALAGVLLYLSGIAYLPREAAEALALVPLLGLAWHWWRQD